jgi:hypothetical protein
LLLYLFQYPKFLHDVAEPRQPFVVKLLPLSENDVAVPDNNRVKIEDDAEDWSGMGIVRANGHGAGFDEARERGNDVEPPVAERPAKRARFASLDTPSPPPGNPQDDVHVASTGADMQERPKMNDIQANGHRSGFDEARERDDDVKPPVARRPAKRARFATPTPSSPPGNPQQDLRAASVSSDEDPISDFWRSQG